jgi:hypothetical protein
MSERVTLELIFGQGQRVLDEVCEMRAEQRERRGRMASIETELGDFRRIGGARVNRPS